MNSFDTMLMPWLNRGAANGVFDAVFPVLTSLHQRPWFLAVVGLAAVIGLWRGDRRLRVCILAALLAVGAADLLAARVVKRLAPRDRPCHRTVDGGYVFPEVRVPTPDRCPGSKSFPSNHAANMMAAGSVFWWYSRKRARWLWFLLPLVIGYTRIYLGYHYPTDVLGGWVLGAATATAAIVSLSGAVPARSTRRADGSADSAG